MKRAFAFLTIFGGAAVPAPTALAWFPVVGVALGAGVGTLWWAAGHWWPPFVAGVIAVMVDLVATGLLHVDGLADTGDGLLAPMSREQRLRVMADPAVGAFGLVVVVIVLTLRIAAVTSLAPSVLALAGLWCASRTMLIVIIRTTPYARPEGIAQSFLAATSTRRESVTLGLSIALGVATAAVLLLIDASVRGLVALVIEFVTMALVVWWARRRLGGFTGDVLGAALVLGETLGLVALVTR